MIVDDGVLPEVARSDGSSSESRLGPFRIVVVTAAVLLLILAGLQATASSADDRLDAPAPASVVAERPPVRPDPVPSEDSIEEANEELTTLAEQGISIPGLPDVVQLSDVEGAVVAHSLPGATSLRIHAGPDTHYPEIWNLAVPDEFGQPRALLVTEVRGNWLRVQVPVRPNGSEGWVLEDDVELRPVTQRIQIDLSDKSVIVWDGDEVVLDTTGAVGRPKDPTPVGSFYVRSVFPWDPDSVYGPWVIPLSAYSETIDQINGGEAVVAIHGTQRPDLLGSEVSLGCIRLANEDITALAGLISAGTPVDIVP